MNNKKTLVLLVVMPIVFVVAVMCFFNSELQTVRHEKLPGRLAIIVVDPAARIQWGQKLDNICALLEVANQTEDIVVVETSRLNAQNHAKIQALRQKDWINLHGRVRYSCFENTPLARALREQGVMYLLIVGFHENMCVRETAKDALKLKFTVMSSFELMRGVADGPIREITKKWYEDNTKMLSFKQSLAFVQYVLNIGAVAGTTVPLEKIPIYFEPAKEVGKFKPPKKIAIIAHTKSYRAKETPHADADISRTTYLASLTARYPTVRAVMILDEVASDYFGTDDIKNRPGFKQIADQLDVVKMPFHNAFDTTNLQAILKKHSVDTLIVVGGDQLHDVWNTCVRARELGYQVLTSLDTMYTKPEFPNDANEDWYKKYTHLVSFERLVEVIKTQK